MATISFYKGQNIVLEVSDSQNADTNSQLKDFGAVAVDVGNEGFFWKVNSISFTPTQNTTDRPHVGTDEEDTIATTKSYEATLDMDWYTADADVTLVGTSTTLHAVDPATILKQVVNGDGEMYTLKLHVGCDLKANAANGNEDFADPDTADFTITLNDVIFTNAPFGANPGDISSTSYTLTVKSADIA